MIYFNFIATFFANPIIMLLFVIIGSSSNGLIFVKTSETNVFDVKLIYYFLLCLLAILLCYIYTAVANKSFLDLQEFLEHFGSKKFSLAKTAQYFFLLFFLVLTAPGLEGNIMGFILFPFLLFSIAAMFVIPTLEQGFYQLFNSTTVESLKQTTITTKYLGQPSQATNKAFNILLHLFNPFVILSLIMSFSMKNHEKLQQTLSFGEGLYQYIASTIAVYLISIVLTIIIFKIFGKSFDIIMYFNLTNSYLNMIPYLCGFLLAVLAVIDFYLMSGPDFSKSFIQLCNFISLPAIGLMVINYFRYLYKS